MSEHPDHGGSLPSRTPSVGWGLAAVVFYLAVAAVSFGGGLFPIRPLYDGMAPPMPYRWVNPPPETFFENEEPESGTGMVVLTKTGSSPTSITTGDGQAGVIVPENAIVPRAGATSATVTIIPMDRTTAAPPHLQNRVSGNAYRIDIVYEGSSEQVTLRRPVTIVLRYVVHATEIWRSGNPEWTLPLVAILALIMDLIMLAFAFAILFPWIAKVMRRIRP